MEAKSLNPAHNVASRLSCCHLRKQHSRDASP
jgi:hypothetical protein